VRKGWNVVATMRSPKELPGAFVVELDVQKPETIARAVDSSLAKFGAIDVVVNNAGYGLFGLFESTSSEKVLEQFEVNVFGVMNITRAVLPHFRARRGGRFVNISSGAGVFGLPMISLYNASKFALEGFSESLSYELGALGIGVRIVEPGGVLETRFGQRSAQESEGAPSPVEYGPFLEQAQAAFARLRASRAGASDSTSAQVAEVIYRAATDETEQLRYVATSDIAPLVKARRETSEAEYLRLMRNTLGLR